MHSSSGRGSLAREAIYWMLSKNRSGSKCTIPIEACVQLKTLQKHYFMLYTPFSLKYPWNFKVSIIYRL